MITLVANRAGTTPAVSTTLLAGAVTGSGWTVASGGLSLRVTRTAVASLPTPPAPPAGSSFVDNGDGTWTATGITDNGDGTWTASITDNGDGTWTA